MPMSHLRFVATDAALLSLVVTLVLVFCSPLVLLVSVAGWLWGVVYTVALWLLAEGVHACLAFRRLRRFATQKPLTPPSLADLEREGVEKMQEKVLDMAATGTGHLGLLHGWFDGLHQAPREGDLFEYACHGLFYRSAEELRGEEGGLEVMQRVREGLPRWMERWGFSVEPGRTPGARVKAWFKEPCEGWLLPLGFYLIVEIAQVWCHVAMPLLGYSWDGASYILPPRACTEGSGSLPVGTCSASEATSSLHSVSSAGTILPAWPRLCCNASTPHQETGQDGIPIVFLHGMGTGVAQNLRLLAALARRYPSSPLVVRHMPHVTPKMPVWLKQRLHSAEEVAEDAVKELRAMGHKSAVWIGQSYGTFVVCAATRMYPSAVAGVVLLDPVALLMNIPRLMNNFLYGRVRTGDGMRIFTADFAKAACSLDPIIRYMVMRRFLWHRCTLWPDEIPPRSVLWVAQKDELLSHDAITRHFGAFDHIQVLSHEGNHGDIVIDPSLFPALLSAIDNLVHHANRAATPLVKLVQGAAKAPAPCMSPATITMPSACFLASRLEHPAGWKQLCSDDEGEVPGPGVVPHSDGRQQGGGTYEGVELAFARNSGDDGPASSNMDDLCAAASLGEQMVGGGRDEGGCGEKMANVEKVEREGTRRYVGCAKDGDGGEATQATTALVAEGDQ